MDELKFKAFAVTHEIDLNKIAVECNIRKKYTWEEEAAEKLMFFFR